MIDDEHLCRFTLQAFDHLQEDRQLLDFQYADIGEIMAATDICFVYSHTGIDMQSIKSKSCSSINVLSQGLERS